VSGWFISIKKRKPLGCDKLMVRDKGCWIISQTCSCLSVRESVLLLLSGNILFLCHK